MNSPLSERLWRTGHIHAQAECNKAMCLLLLALYIYRIRGFCFKSILHLPLNFYLISSNIYVLGILFSISITELVPLSQSKPWFSSKRNRTWLLLVQVYACFFLCYCFSQICNVKHNCLPHSMTEHVQMHLVRSDQLSEQRFLVSVEWQHHSFGSISMIVLFR